MSINAFPVNEAEILAAVIAPHQATFPPEIAKVLLNLQFGPDQISRMRELAERNNAGTLSEKERHELASYARVGDFLSLVQSKARLSIKLSGE